MRLYSRTGATAIDDPDHGRFEADEDGGFDLPHDLATRLHSFAFAGERQWETDIERQNRLIAEEIERRKDPATLLDAVNRLVEQATGNAAEDVVKKTPARRPRKPATPKSSD